MLIFWKTWKAFHTPLEFYLDWFCEKELVKYELDAVNSFFSQNWHPLPLLESACASNSQNRSSVVLLQKLQKMTRLWLRLTEKYAYGENYVEKQLCMNNCFATHHKGFRNHCESFDATLFFFLTLWKRNTYLYCFQLSHRLLKWYPLLLRLLYCYSQEHLTVGDNILLLFSSTASYM